MRRADRGKRRSKHVSGLSASSGQNHSLCAYRSDEAASAVLGAAMRRLALLLVAALCGGGADLDAPMPMLKITLHHGAADKRYAPPDAHESLARIEFCAYCEDPHTEGSLARGLTCSAGAPRTRDYKITSKLVYALPNDAATPPMNADELTGNVALVHRSATPLVQKILHAQEAGAVGVVLVDDGRCESDLNCGRIGSARLGGFAPRDDPSSWRLVKIPSVLVSQETGKRIRRLMPCLFFNLKVRLGTRELCKSRERSASRRIDVLPVVASDCKEAGGGGRLPTSLFAAARWRPTRQDGGAGASYADGCPSTVQVEL